MKIHSIHNQRIGQTVNRLLAILGAVLVGIAASGVAHAQGGFLDRLTAGDRSEISLPSATAGGVVNFGNEAFRVVKSSTVPNVANPARSGFIRQTSMLACESCGTNCGGSCGGISSGSACGSCGTSCGGSCGGGYSAYGMGNYDDACGIPCEPYWYGSIEAIYMSREGKDQFTLAENIRLDRRFDEFDYATAGRYTIGRCPDCVNGCELTYSGTLDWDFGTAYTTTDPAGLQTFLMPGNPVPPSDLSAFTDANYISQTYEARYYSVELSRTLVGWDVSKLVYGIRYIDYDEEYRYDSAAGGQTGVLRSETENALIGFQVGMDLLYPVCDNGYIDVRGRGGLYVDFAESDVRLINNNVLVLLNQDDTTEIVGVLEFGAGLRYELGEVLSIRGGAEVWYISDVASAGNQLGNGVVTPTLGRGTSVNEDIFFLGLNGGFQLRF